jgi:putative Mg2+ transporter-C (MgtC) family protein
MMSRIWVFMTTAIIIIVSVVLLALADGSPTLAAQTDLATHPSVLHVLGMSGRLLLAIGLTVGIGLEREARHKPAGVRTVAMVGVGACIFALVGEGLSRQLMQEGAAQAIPIEAVSRIIQGIITGIGFLGAGTIMKDQFHIEGLTTAATLWAAAAIGLCCGIGQYPLAILGTVAVFVILTALRIAERMVRPE